MAFSEKTVLRKALEDFCIEAMRKAGMNKEQARITAEVLVTNDTLGVTTHGSKQLRLLLNSMKNGGLNPKAQPQIISEGPGWAIIDGNYTMPMVTCCQAMQTAISKAKNTGISYVGVKNSSHFAAAGYYANLAAKENMIGLAMCNVDPCMAIPGAKSEVIGTNPIGYAVPAGKEKPVFLDIATSVTAISKVYAAKVLGKKIPENWLIDAEGNMTTDPSKYPGEGAILPMAGHKGYGIAVLIEVLSGVLTGAGFTKGVKRWLTEFKEPVNQGHAFLAINIGAMMPIQQFKDRMDAMIQEIRSAPKAKGADRIYLPGEMEWEKQQASGEKITLPGDSVERLVGMAEDWGLDITKIFKE